MAGFDINAQKSYTLPGGGRGESGKIDFSQNSFCSAVPTRLSSVYSYSAFPAVDYTKANANVFTNDVVCDMSINTNGSICFRRMCSRTDLSSSVYYTLQGW